MGSSFHDQLVSTRDKKHSKNHTFFELWVQGKLTKEQTADWDKTLAPVLTQWEAKDARNKGLLDAMRQDLTAGRASR